MEHSQSAAPSLFTCLLPIYGRDDPTAFRKALLSIYENTLQPVEVILCQDGELPEKLEAVVVNCSQDVVFKRVIHDGKPGLHNNLNHALQFVRTPWICRADADDINHKLRFETQVRYLENHSNITALGSAIRETYPTGIVKIKRMPRGASAILAWATYRNPINHMTAFVRTEAVISCGGYPNVRYKEDYALWLKLLANGSQLENLDEPLVDVAVDYNFFARRGGTKNIRSEFALLNIKLQSPKFSRRKSIFAFLSRTAALCTPRHLLKFIYKILRS